MILRVLNGFLRILITAVALYIILLWIERDIKKQKCKFNPLDNLQLCLKCFEKRNKEAEK